MILSYSVSGPRNFSSPTPPSTPSLSWARRIPRASFFHLSDLINPFPKWAPFPSRDLQREISVIFEYRANISSLCSLDPIDLTAKPTSKDPALADFRDGFIHPESPRKGSEPPESAIHANQNGRASACGSFGQRQQNSSACASLHRHGKSSACTSLHRHEKSSAYALC